MNRQICKALDMGEVGMADYYKSKEFQEHRNRVNYMLEKYPSVESPKGWIRKGEFSVGGFEHFGFSESSDILFVASSQGRGLIDMDKNERIARDYSKDYPIDETFLVSEGFDILEGQTVKLSSKYGGSLLPVCNSAHETLVRVSPLYPCEDIIFQPPWENCFSEGHNKNCVRIYRGFLCCFGFSFSGKYFVIADDGGIMYWKSTHAE